MYSMSYWIFIYLFNVCVIEDIFCHIYGAGDQSVFDLTDPAMLQCNGTACDSVDLYTNTFLDTAPCPPVWNLSLICQHSCFLQCQEVAVILDRCILQYGLDCDAVFSALEACVCDFNMSCPEMNNTYINNCGWKDKDYYCQADSRTGNSLSSTLVVTLSNIGSSQQFITQYPETRETTGQTQTNEFTDDIKSTTEDEWTTRIGESRPGEGSCDSVCIVLAVVLPTIFIAALVGLYHCYKCNGKRPGKTAPLAMTKVNCIDSKDTKSFSSNTSHKGKEKPPPFPSLERSLAHKTGCLTVGRPCSGFCTNMFDKGDQNRDPKHYIRDTAERAWEDNFPSELPLSETGSVVLKIPRPSLVTFRYNVESQSLQSPFVECCKNPLFEECIQ